MRKIINLFLFLLVSVACDTTLETQEELNQEQLSLPHIEQHSEQESMQHIETHESEETNLEEAFTFEDLATVETLATGLQIPWSLQKMDNIFYISERGGAIVRIENEHIQRETVQLTKQVAHVGEAGFLGFILDPSFPENQLAYAYHTYEENGRFYNRVIQLQHTEKVWQEIQVLLEDIPGAKFHNGGRLQIGPDSKLYVTTGDALQPKLAQDPDNLAGKILRMELDGTIPKDNPFPNSYIFSYGHRNPQGLAWNEDGSVMYSSEHGESAHDEINLITAGQNYGWPIIQGDEAEVGMVSPMFHSGMETWAPSGISYARNNQLFVTGLRGNQLLLFDLEQEIIRTILEGEGRLRDVLITDQAIYVITNNLDGRGTPTQQDDRLLKLK